MFLGWFVVILLLDYGIPPFPSQKKTDANTSWLEPANRWSVYLHNGGGHTIGNLAIIIIEIHIFRSTDSLIETGDWQFCMFYISRTTPLAFYLVGIFVWSDNTKQKVRLTKVTPFWRVWLVWSYLVVLPYMGIGFEVFISYGSRKQL